MHINPKNGVANGVVRADILPLEKNAKLSDDLLYGIPFDKKASKIWVTGKVWSKVYFVNVAGLRFDLLSCTSQQAFHTNEICITVRI